MKVYQTAPSKRMSILERRAGDGRAYFSHHWHEVHGGMVSRMPHLFAYIQNHIVEEFLSGHAGFSGDGIVEQLWRSTVEMQKGYSSAVVKDLIADEANYLGHGSNYAILAQESLREAPEGNKLIVAVRHGGEPALADAVADFAAEVCHDVLRDDVIATIAKPNFLPVPPRPVDMFLHLYGAGAADASQVGARIAERTGSLSLGPNAAIAVWRVGTRTIVRPD